MGGALPVPSSRKRHLSAGSASHTQSTQGPRDEFQWHISMHTSFRAICCSPRAAPTPPSQCTKTPWAGCSKPRLHYGVATAHTTAGKTVPAQKKTRNSGWIKRAAGRGWNLERKKKMFTSHLNHSHEGWNFPNWPFLKTLTTAPQTGRWCVSKFNPGGHKRSKPQPVCISFNEIVSVTPGCKSGSDWVPDYGYFLNMDFIFFLLNFMCLEAKQGNSQISKNQHTKACPLPSEPPETAKKNEEICKTKSSFPPKKVPATFTLILLPLTHGPPLLSERKTATESRSQWEDRWQWRRTHQWLVDEAEHVGVVEEDVHWSLGMKTDVCDGSVPLEPKMMKPLLLDSPAPFRVLFVWDAVLKYLRKNMTQRKCRLVPRKPEGHSWPEKQLYKPCLYHIQDTHFHYFFFFGCTTQHAGS